VIAAVVLAAGNSERMGRPKALLEVEGETFLGRICRRLREAGVKDIVVALGRDAESVLEGWPRANEKVVVNPRPEDGMISSLKPALKALPPSAGAALVCLADAPLVAPQTYARLIAEWRRAQGFLVVPRHNGKRGHPLVLDQRFWPQAPNDLGLHWVTHGNAAWMRDVDVEDPGVVKDFDTPDEYRRLVEESRG
jgi:molybdenum cofactor cytidylyltransferase